MQAQAKLQRQAAEVVFANVDDLHRAMPALIEHDFEVIYLSDWFDPCELGSAWMLTWTITRLETGEIMNLISDLAEPFGGYLMAAGATTDAELEAWMAEGRED